MKRYVAAALVSVSLAPAALAEPPGDPVRPGHSFDDFSYVAASAGWHLPNDVTDNQFDTTVQRDQGFGLHAAVGHQYRQFRAEAEVGWFRGDMGDSGNGDTISLMINAYYDVDTGTSFRPYIGGGVGGALITLHGVRVANLGTFKDDTTGLAWQAMAGVSYDLSERLSLYGGYRWFDVFNVKFESETGVRLKFDNFGSHNVEFGIRYRL